MSAQAANPFLQQLELLKASVPTPPHSYRLRLIGLLIICSLLTLLSLTYLVILIHDHFKRGKRIHLFRYTRLQHGTRLIVPNTLFIYVILEACGGVCLTAYSARKYQAYILDSVSRKNLSILGTISWLFPLTAAWVFVFSTLSASLRAKGAYFAESSIATWAHNIIFFAFPTTYICITLPLACLANYHGNQVIDIFDEAVVLLTRGATEIANGQGADLTIVLRLAQKAEEVKESLDMSVPYLWALLAIAMTITILYALITAFTWTFVRALRKQSRWGVQRSSSIFITQQSISVIDGPLDPKLSDDDAATPVPHIGKRLALVNIARLSLSALKKARSAQAVNPPSEEAIRLARLANDLSLSVPLLCVEAVFFTLTGILVLTVTVKDRNWKAREFEGDALTWCHGITCIILFFIVNAVIRPGRFGRATTTDQGGESTKGALSISQVTPMQDNREFHVQMASLGKLAEDEDAGARPSGQALSTLLPDKIDEEIMPSSGPAMARPSLVTWDLEASTEGVATLSARAA